MTDIAYKFTDPSGSSQEISVKEVDNFLSRVVKKVRGNSNTKNKIGIIIAITSEDEEQKKCVDNDITRAVNNFLNTRDLRGLFNIISLENEDALKINNSNWEEIVRKRKSHLIVYGHASERGVKGVKNYSLKLEAGVVHNPIPIVFSKLLSQDFAQVFPRERYFPKDDNLLGFEISAEWISVAVEYMIGTAAYVSGFLGSAWAIFNDLNTKLAGLNKSSNVEAVKELKIRLPWRIVEVALSICDFLYVTYSFKRDVKFIAQTKKFIDAISFYGSDDVRVKHFISIYRYLIEHDIPGAISMEKEADDPLKYWNLGFLSFVNKQINEGFRYYKHAVKRNVPEKALFDMEAFICDELRIKPDNIQLNFALGFINYKGKEDFKLAIKDFKEFISGSKSRNLFPELQRLAEIYINEIRKKI